MSVFSSLKSFGKTLLHFLLAIVFNLIFSLVFLGIWLSGATLAESPLAILLFALFLIGFPFLYFWLGRKNLFFKGIETVYEGAKPVLHGELGGVLSSLVMGNELAEKGTEKLGLDFDEAKSYLSDFEDKIPGPLQVIFEKIPVYGAIKEITEQFDLTEENLPLLQSELNTKVDNQVKSMLVFGSSIWFWLLLAANILAVVIAWQIYA